MQRTAKKRTQGGSTKRDRTIAQTRAVDAAGTIRQIGNDWARHWNAGELDEVVAAYAADAVYLPPHHPSVHGRDSIREYLKAPLSHGVSDLAFDVTYIKQQGPVAWDVGTYRMNAPVNGGMRKEDHGKYLTVWRRVGKKWLIAADAWSSDLPPSR